MQKIFETSSRIEAEIIKGKLESEGISALIRTDDEGGTNPGLHMIVGCSIFVHASDFLEALEILES